MAGHILRENCGEVSKLRFKGVFDYYKFMNFIISWLKDRGYDVEEKNNKHKASAPHGFEIEWSINASRKVTDFILYKIDVEILALDAHEVEAIKNEKKETLWHMRIEIRPSFSVVCDYRGDWEKNALLEKLRNFFICYIIKKRLLSHGGKLYYITLGFQTEMKKFFEMSSTANPQG